MTDPRPALASPPPDDAARPAPRRMRRAVATALTILALTACGPDQAPRQDAQPAASTEADRTEDGAAPPAPRSAGRQGLRDQPVPAPSGPAVPPPPAQPVQVLMEPMPEDPLAAGQRCLAQARNGTRPTWRAPAPGADAETALRTGVEGVQRELGVRVHVAVRNRATGQVLGVNARQEVPADASLAKVPVAMAYLARQPEPTPPEQAQQVRSALESSDNLAALALFDQLGPADQGVAALQAVYHELGLTSTTATEVWGGQPTTAEDQLAVLDGVRQPPAGLGPQQQQLLRDAMRPAVPADRSQAFGVGALQDPRALPAGSSGRVLWLKNGWVPDVDGTWITHTMGSAAVDGRTLDLVILTAGSPGRECGFGLVSELAVLAATAGTPAAAAPLPTKAPAPPEPTFGPEDQPVGGGAVSTPAPAA